jgi:hypothetical protein
MGGFNNGGPIEPCINDVQVHGQALPAQVDRDRTAIGATMVSEVSRDADGTSLCEGVDKGAGRSQMRMTVHIGPTLAAAIKRDAKRRGQTLSVWFVLAATDALAKSPPGIVLPRHRKLMPLETDFDAIGGPRKRPGAR